MKNEKGLIKTINHLILINNENLFFFLLNKSTSRKQHEKQ